MNILQLLSFRVLMAKKKRGLGSTSEKEVRTLGQKIQPPDNAKYCKK